MAKRGRPAKTEQEALLPITILIPSRLKEALEDESKAAGRPLSETVRRRLVLHESKVSGAAVMDEALSPRARAIGRFVAFVVNELATVSQSREQYENLKVGVGRLIERIVATGNLSPSAEPGAMIADYWWLRMMNAREPTVEDGVSTPATVEQKALMEIRKTLVPPDAKAATKGQRSRKE